LFTGLADKELPDDHPVKQATLSLKELHNHRERYLPGRMFGIDDIFQVLCMCSGVAILIGVWGWLSRKMGGSEAMQAEIQGESALLLGGSMSAVFGLFTVMLGITRLCLNRKTAKIFSNLDDIKKRIENKQPEILVRIKDEIEHIESFRDNMARHENLKGQRDKLLKILSEDSAATDNLEPRAEEPADHQFLLRVTEMRGLMTLCNINDPIGIMIDTVALPSDPQRKPLDEFTMAFASLCDRFQPEIVRFMLTEWIIYHPRMAFEEPTNEARAKARALGKKIWDLAIENGAMASARLTQDGSVCGPEERQKALQELRGRLAAAGVTKSGPTTAPQVLAL